MECLFMQSEMKLDFSTSKNLDESAETFLLESGTRSQHRGQICVHNLLVPLDLVANILLEANDAVLFHISTRDELHVDKAQLNVSSLSK